MQTRILFIINPKSGSSAIRVDVPALLEQFLDKAIFEYSIKTTEYAGHATEIASAAAKAGIPVVCAVGGDGTVNEVARGLVNTNTALAILPRGSGNGLARHLGISMNLSQAITVLNGKNISTIDTGLINERPFFCTAGLGFDAHISSVFATSLKRGLQTYARIVMRECLTYKPEKTILELNDQRLETDCFVVAFANASQYGNNVYIAPMADIRDGLLDVCLIKELTVAKVVAITYGLATKQIASSGAEYFTTRAIKVTTEKPFKYHTDGEYIAEATEFLVSVLPLSLKVIIPPVLT